MSVPAPFDDAALRKIAQPPNDPSTEYGCVFPLGWYESLLQEIQQRGIVALTYSDLFAHSDDRDWENCYEREFKHWHEHIRDPQATYLLIQHDVDFVPDFTKRMVALEALYGIRSSIFVFNRFVDEIPADSPYDDSPYVVDHEFFTAMQQRGFVIGYHQNALSVTKNLEDATQQFANDVMALREHYDIRYFCPHGGRAVEIDGRRLHNFDVPVPDVLRDSLRWVYNRYALRYSGRFSDGGLRRVNDPQHLQRLNLAGFLNALEPGRRYFALIHPQLWGYNINRAYNPALSEQQWYQQKLRDFG